MDNIKLFCDKFDERDVTQYDITRICKLYTNMIEHCGGPYKVRGAYRRALQVIAIDRILSGWNERWYAYYKEFNVRSRHFSTLLRRYPNIEFIMVK